MTLIIPREESQNLFSCQLVCNVRQSRIFETTIFKTRRRIFWLKSSWTRNSKGWHHFQFSSIPQRRPVFLPEIAKAFHLHRAVIALLGHKNIFCTLYESCLWREKAISQIRKKFKNQTVNAETTRHDSSHRQQTLTFSERFRLDKLRSSVFILKGWRKCRTNVVLASSTRVWKFLRTKAD